MKEQFKLDNQLCFRLYTASRLVTQAYHPLLSGFGLTYPQYLVLMVLWEKDEQPVNDIAKRLLLETNTVTPLLKRMETEGILTRSKGTQDARQIIVKLTEKGQHLQEELTDVPATMGRSILCKSVNPDTVPSLFCTLDDIIDTLANNDKKPSACKS
jgi:DNA-binding MarR family transcriptional regulator